MCTKRSAFDKNEESCKDIFATTHWSVLTSAGQDDSPEALEAADRLCQIYWRPVFHFARRQGLSSHDAQDLTQAFFAKLLEKNLWARADREKGRFRTFLLNALTQFMSDQRDRAHAAKRGGGIPLLPLDELAFEAGIPVAQQLSCEEIFDRRWASTLLQQARAKLRAECIASGKLALFENLESVGTSGANSLTYAELAARMNTSIGALKTAISRLRDRYGQLIRQEIAQTVSQPSEVDEEITYLRSLL